VPTVADATRVAANFACALVDLGLPDGVGLDTLARLRASAPDLAIVVLTGLNDRSAGLAAVAAGAQDYLVKGNVDGVRLSMAVRYAVERRRAELSAQQLILSARRQDENDRLARGLLPLLRVDSRSVDAATHYRPGSSAILGGDFLDAVALSDGSLRAVIGDVCGHGPSEAALGVALRIAWRTMTLDQRPPTEVLAAVDGMLALERSDDTYATLCDVTILAGATSVEVRLHGHPPPLVRRNGRWAWLDGPSPAPPLGVGVHRAAPATRTELGADWALLLVTDGVYEGWHADDRLGMDGLVDVLDRLSAAGLTGSELLVATAAATAGDGTRVHDDDMALLWLSTPR
jgi:serine phosphatase RsbU (regulator of sigma subunit)